MATTTKVSLDDGLSFNDALDVGQDVKRMVRRARAIKSAQGPLEQSIENLLESLGSMISPEEGWSFDRLLELAQENRGLALQAIKPFTGFFYSNGLLPDSVKKDALLLYVLVEACQRHPDIST